MTEGENLLNSLTAGLGANEEHIVIGRDRIVVVPESLTKIAVQYDHNVETVTFDCPRYWDDLDLSTMTVYVNYMRSDGNMGATLASKPTVDENDEDLMHFTWTLSNNVTQVKGNLTILVCIKDIDEEGNETYHWNSELNTDMYIAEGLECQETILLKYPDVIMHLLSRMEELEEIGLSHTVDVTEIDNGHRITLKDSTGTKTVDVIDGVDFIPSVSTTGDISWTNNKGLENPPIVNIRGPKGAVGPAGTIYENIEMIEGVATVDPLRPYRLKINETYAEPVKHFDFTGKMIYAGTRLAAVGTKIYMFYPGQYVNVLDMVNKTVTELSIQMPSGAYSDRKPVVIGTKIYLIGPSSSMYVLDTESEKMIQVSSDIMGLAGVTPVAVGTKIYLFGGGTNDSDATDTIQVFDTETNETTTLPNVLPIPIFDMYAVTVGTKIYLLGGRNDSTNSMNDYLNIWMTFDTRDKRIDYVSYTLPQKISTEAVVAVGTNIYILTNTLGNKNYVFNTTTETFSESSLPIDYYNSGAVLIDNKICYLGHNTGTGYQSDYRYPIWEMDVFNYKLEFSCSGVQYEFSTYINPKYDCRDTFEFEITSLVVDASGTTLTIAYKVDGELNIVKVTGENIDVSDAQLVITGAKQVLGYNTSITDGFIISTIEVDDTLLGG